MAAFDLSTFFLYRYRYIIGYTLIGLLLTALLIFAGLYVPGGISSSEVLATVVSSSISLTDPSTYVVVNLPYYLFQSAIFSLFGVNEFTIKLPSLILALISAIGLILLLRRWFKPGIAVLTSLIAITTGQFLLVSQTGTPSIMYIFWPIALLLLGTQVTRGKHLQFLWKVLFSITAILSLYTPLSIYPLIAILLAIILHPHLRNAIRRLSKVRLFVCIIVAGVAMVPLVLGIMANPNIALTLLGWPQTLPIDIWGNIVIILRQYFLFWEPSTTGLMTPVFGLGSTIIIGLGLYRLIRTRETTRSYLIMIWLACLVPVLIINPLFTTVTFVPLVLVLAAGLTSLITYWYRLFPLNPYARISGLIPLVVLVVVLIGSGLNRFVYGYHYDPMTRVNFSQDIRLLPENTKQLVVSESEKAFYESVAKYEDDLSVSLQPTTDNFTVTRAAKTDFAGYKIDRIITTTYSEDSDRFYIYKKV